METFASLTKSVFRSWGFSFLSIVFPAPSPGIAMAELDIPKVRPFL